MQRQNNTTFEFNLRLHNRLWDDISSLADITRAPGHNTLNLLHHNVKSLTNKIYFYESLDLSNSVDIFSISETWLKPEIPDSIVELPGFNIIRCDRKSATKTRGGGAALYVNSALKFTHIKQPQSKLSELCDSVWINIKAQQTNDNLIVGSIYLPPDADKMKFITLLSDILHQKQFINKKLVLLGDFNINWNSSSREKHHIQQNLISAGLNQVIIGSSFVSNHGNESLIDHNYVNCDLTVKASKILTCERAISDHYATFLTLDKMKPKKLIRKLIKTRNFRKLNPVLFYNDCALLPLKRTATDPNLSIHERTEKMDKLIINVVDKHAPEKTMRVRNKKSQWLTPEVRRLITLKNRFYKQIFRHTNSPSVNQIQHYKKFRNYVTNQIRTAKKVFISKSLSENDKSFYTCLKSLTKKKSQMSIESLDHNNVTHTNEKDIASALNEFFVNVAGRSEFNPINFPHAISETNSHTFKFCPITSKTVCLLIKTLNPDKRGGQSRMPAMVYKIIVDLISYPLSLLINECYEKSIFPDCLKSALVTPIHKKGNTNDPSNYRPISSLPIISKIFELDMKNQMVSFIEENNLFSDRQFGFRQNHSTEQMLLSVLQEWKTKLDQPTPCYIGALSLDVRKAFDTINHKLLLYMLTRKQFSSSSTKLLQSYLNNRSQVMKVGESRSDPLMIACGVPQGSILGPILFNIAINELLTTFKLSFAYADDTLLYCEAATINDILHKSQSLLEKASEWYESHLLKLNIDKTQFCIFSNRNIKEYYHINFHNTKVESQLSINVLGVTLDTNLSFQTHATETATKANKIVYLLSKLKKYMNVEDSLKTYKILIRPILEYCSAIYLDATQKVTETIEKVQNKAIRIIVSAPKKFSVTTGRSLLNLPTLQSRRQYLFHNFTHKKVAKNKASKHILNLVQKSNKHQRCLRSNCSIIKPSFRTNFGKSALLNLLHKFRLKNNSAKTILTFNLPGT